MQLIQTAIQVAALGGAIGCFIVFWVVSLKQIAAAQKTTTEAADRINRGEMDSMDPVTIAQVGEILKAIASLAESLAKAGPALWSLIGSLLFLLIAAMSAGLIVGGSA